MAFLLSAVPYPLPEMKLKCIDKINFRVISNVIIFHGQNPEITASYKIMKGNFELRYDVKCVLSQKADARILCAFHCTANPNLCFGNS